MNSTNEEILNLLNDASREDVLQKLTIAVQHLIDKDFNALKIL